MPSLSSQMVSAITAYRNPNGTEYQWTKVAPHVRKPADCTKVYLAELGYIAVIPFSIVEAALSAIAKLASLYMPIGRKGHEAMSNWMYSSTFSVKWSLGDAAINIFCNDMIVTEKVARDCAASGRYSFVPRASTAIPDGSLPPSV